MHEFSIFGYSFSSYWTMLILGAAATVLLSILRAKKYEIGKVKAIIIALFVVILGCVGAKLLYILEAPGASFSLRGGMSLYGSIILIPAGFGVLCFLLRMRYAGCMDFVAVFGPLIFALMRIGCYLGGCCGGREVELFGSSFVPPVQLIEAVLDVGILSLLLKRENKAASKITGTQYPLFMACYGFIRFFIEFWRDTPKIYFGFSEGQWLSVLSFLTGAGILYLLKKKRG